MRYLYSLFLLFFTSAVLASPHHITPLINYNMDQDTGTGYGFEYNYTIFEGFEVETIYLHSNAISYQTSETELTGEFDNLLLGVNVLKQYNDDLSFKLGGGFGYTFNSDNETLVTDKQVNPYLKFTFNYRTSDSTSFEFGQIAQKVDGDLSVSHSVFAGFSWKFGDRSSIKTSYKAKTEPAQQPLKKSPTLTASPTPVIETKIHPTQTQPTPTVIAPVQAVSTPWYLQLGAYNNLHHAQAALSSFSDQFPELKLTVKSASSLYRVVSYGFTDKASAASMKQHLDKTYGIASYVAYLP